MGAQKGKDLLLKLDFDQNGVFETVAGMRSRRIAFNAEAIDITNADSAGRWRELLEGAGVRRAGISGAGIFKDAASDASVRELFFDGAIRTWQVVVPDFGTISGPFQVTGLEYAGEHDGEVAYEMALESAGRSFAAASVSRPSHPTSQPSTPIKASMANRHRGEIAVLDGRERTLCLTLGALAELEASFGAEDLVALAGGSRAEGFRRATSPDHRLRAARRAARR